MNHPLFCFSTKNVLWMLWKWRAHISSAFIDIKAWKLQWIMKEASFAGWLIEISDITDWDRSSPSFYKLQRLSLWRQPIKDALLSSLMFTDIFVIVGNLIRWKIDDHIDRILTNRNLTGTKRQEKVSRFKNLM